MLISWERRKLDMVGIVIRRILEQEQAGNVICVSLLMITNGVNLRDVIALFKTRGGLYII